MLDRLMPPRRAPLFVLALASATILGALVFEHGLGYAPCVLCLEQRWPYYTALPVVLLALIVSREANLGRWPAWLMALAGGIFAVSAMLALRHMGVEWGWWDGPAGCSGSGVPASLDAFIQALDGATVVPCDTPAWTFLGLSLAGYNFMISLVLMAASFSPLYATWKERHTP